MKAFVATIVTAGLLAFGVSAVVAQSGNDLFQQALVKERTAGDLNAAIALYQTIVQKHTSNRALVAKALVQMGGCYDKLGSGDAIKTYERVAREFADQPESAATARTRLAALTRPGPPASASGVVVRQVWTGPGVDLMGAPSSDGRYLSFVDWETGDLALRDLSTGENRRLTDGPAGEFAFHSRISPDSRQVAYVWVDKANPYHLRVTSINDLRNGVKPRVLFRQTDSYMAFGDWSPDGKTVLANIRGIDLVSVSDGAITTVKTLSGRPAPRFSPDGRWIVYHAQPNQNSAGTDIFVLATDGSRETTLVEHPGNDVVLGWAPDGQRILFASDRTGVTSAWVIAVEDGRPRGAPELVKSDIGNIQPMGFTRTGAFYYGVTTGGSDVYIATLDPETGRVVTDPMPVSQQFQGRGSSPAWSPDGQFIAYLSNRTVTADSLRGLRVICIRSVKTGDERVVEAPLSFDNAYRLQWSPDGRFLLATVRQGGRGGLYRINAVSGAVAPLEGLDPWYSPHGVWSSDGRAIFYSHRDTESKTPGTNAIRRRDLETGRETELYRSAASGPGPNNLALSTDGQWLAFGLGSGVTSHVLMIMPSAGGAPRELLQPGDGQGVLTGIEWASDGRHLFFTKGAGGFKTPGLAPELWRIPVDGGAPQRVGLATQDRGTLAIHPDGRQIAFTAGATKREVWVMENLLAPLKAGR